MTFWATCEIECVCGGGDVGEHEEEGEECREEGTEETGKGKSDKIIQQASQIDKTSPPELKTPD